MHTFCALVGNNRTPIADYKISITGENNSLTSTEYEQKCAHMATVHEGGGLMALRVYQRYKATHYTEAQ
jgi:hypothetical protein